MAEAIAAFPTLPLACARTAATMTRAATSMPRTMPRVRLVSLAVRFGLRTSSWQVSELCLGAGPYSEGLDTFTLLPAKGSRRAARAAVP